MNSYFQKIEETLDCKFPIDFKNYISSLNGDEIIFELPDDNYRLLFSLSKNEEIDSWEEDVIKCSKEFDNNYYPEDKDFIKLPFARILTGDGYVYLYFQSKKEEESNGEIFIRDLDSPKTSRIRISENLNLIKGKISSTDNSTKVNCKEKSILEMSNFLTISNNINNWKDSFGVTSRENVENKPPKMETQCGSTIYVCDDVSENFVKIEIQISLVDEKNIIEGSKAFEIDIAGLKEQIEENVNYRIFYHKFICVVDCLKDTMSNLEEKGILSREDFNHKIDSNELISQVKKRFVQIDYGTF